jgi:hypothetical protein
VVYGGAENRRVPALRESTSPSRARLATLRAEEVDVGDSKADREARRRMACGPRPPPGVLIRRVGKRVVVRRPDEREVARTADGRWLLVAVAGWSRPPWVSCKVFDLRPAAKNVYHVGVSTTTWADNRSRDAAALRAAHAGVIEWAIDKVFEAHTGVQRK